MKCKNSIRKMLFNYLWLWNLIIALINLRIALSKVAIYFLFELMEEIKVLFFLLQLSLQTVDIIILNKYRWLTSSHEIECTTQ